jgi:hypothetical protein
MIQASIPALQRTIGNRSVRRLLQKQGQRGRTDSGPVQRPVPAEARMSKVFPSP